MGNLREPKASARTQGKCDYAATRETLSPGDAASTSAGFVRRAFVAPPRRSPGVDPVVQNSLSAGPGWLNPSPGPQGSKSAPIPPSLDDQPRRLVRCTWQSTEGRERMRQLSDAVAILPPHRRPVCTRQSQIGVPQVLAGTISPAHLVNRLREHGNPPALIGKSPAITLRETCDGELQRKTAL